MALPVSELIRLMAQAIPRMLARTAAGLTIADDNGVLALSGEHSADLNMLVIGTCRDAPQRLEEAARLVEMRKLPLLALFSPDVNERLAARVEDLGFASSGTVPLMVLPANANVSPFGECEIARVSDEQEARVASELQAGGFGLPETSTWTLLENSFSREDAPSVFVASRGGIAMSTVTMTDHGGAAGIWTMATPPRHQRKGIGRALLTRVITQGRAGGAKEFYLAATQAGRPLYDSIGFRPAAELSAWVLGDSVQVHK